MLHIIDATITADDDHLAALQDLPDNGRYQVIFSGDDLTISAPDFSQSQDQEGAVLTMPTRNKRLDRLTQVVRTDSKNAKDGTIFTGISDHLVMNVGIHPDDAIITLSVKGTQVSQ